MKKLVLFVAVLFVLFIFSGISQAAEKKAAKLLAAKEEFVKPEVPKTIVGVWTAIGGRVYDTAKGDDFSCKLSLKDSETLILSGCLAFLCEHNFYPRVK